MWHAEEPDGQQPTTFYNKANKKNKESRCKGGAEQQSSGNAQSNGLLQGEWKRLNHALDHTSSCSELWLAKPQCIKLLVQSVYNVLLTSSNHFCWGKVKIPACPMCEQDHWCFTAVQKSWERAANSCTKSRCCGNNPLIQHPLQTTETSTSDLVRLKRGPKYKGQHQGSLQHPMTDRGNSIWGVLHNNLQVVQIRHSFAHCESEVT